MYELKLCKTRDYHPRLLEHWLHTIQKDKNEKTFLLKNEDGKVKVFCDTNLEENLQGSRCIKTEISAASLPYFVRQSKGALMPIKRYAQFEDRVNKERIYPMDDLIFAMSKIPNSEFKISFKAIKDKTREKALHKAKEAWFKAERKFDQWESNYWFHFNFKKFFARFLRKFFTQKNSKESDEKIESQHEREDPKTATLDKLSRPLFEVEISTSAPFKSFINGFGLAYLNSLKVTQKKSRVILSAEELASILNLPNPKNCLNQLNLESSAYLAGPKIEMSEEDRKRHLYIVGKTGMGKSTLILNFIKKDIEENKAIVVIDPHGDLADEALNLVPKSRLKDLIYINPSLDEFPIAINPLELLEKENANLKASATTEIFEVLAKGSWGPRLEYILRNAILTLVLSKNTCLLDIPRLLNDYNFYKNLNIKDLELIRFWEKEFFALETKTRQEFIAPILNKVGPLLTSPLLRNIFGQPVSKLHFDRAIDSKKIILINLSKGKIGEDASRALGMIFISMIQSALLARASKPDRPMLGLFIDEFQNFSTKTLLSMLAESRKYGLALTIANQYLTQLTPEIQDAVLGNAGSIISFRTSFQDAERLAPQFSLTEEDLTELEPFNAYARVLKNSRLQPICRFETEAISTTKSPEILKTLQISLEKYGRRRSFIEEKLMHRYTEAT